MENPQTQTFEVKKDPRLATTPEEYARQLEVALQIHNKLSQTNEAVIQHPRYPQTTG